MPVICAPRASAILFTLLASTDDARPWILPANICPVVPFTFHKARIPFEFLDLSPDSLHIDLERAAALVETGRYGGLLYAHTYGEPSTPQTEFEALKARRPDLVLVDDRCLCVPDLGAPPTAADLTLYSTGHAKIVDLGFGGFAFIRHGLPYEGKHPGFESGAYAALEEKYKRALRDRAHFTYVDSPWLDTSSLSPSWDEYRTRVAAALPLSLEGRRQLNDIYAAGLPREIQLPQEYQTWRFSVRVPNQAQILSAVAGAGLFASAHYASLPGILAEGSAPVAEAVAAEVVNFFNDHHFTPRMAESACRIVREHLR